MAQQVRWYDPRIVRSDGLYPYLVWHRGLLFREYGEYHREVGLLHPAESETLKRLILRRMKARRRRPQPKLPHVTTNFFYLQGRDGWSRVGVAVQSWSTGRTYTRGAGYLGGY